jgi:predicted GIY-YIG superfamily endonuclease
VIAAILRTPMPFVYILRCDDDSLYTGIAKDVARRLAEHNAGRASRYTRVRRPVSVAWSRRVRSWSLALKEEYRIKQLPRAAKLALVRSGTTPPAAAVRGARRRGR